MRKMILDYDVFIHPSDGSYDDYDQMFSEDLVDYMDITTKKSTRVVSIVPELDTVIVNKCILRVTVNYVVNPDISHTDQISSIEDYVSGQISDGWGENGCTYGDYLYTFDWKRPRMYDREMTKEETDEVMSLVNQKIKEREEMRRTFEDELRHLLGLAQKMGV